MNTTIKAPQKSKVIGNIAHVTCKKILPDDVQALMKESESVLNDSSQTVSRAMYLARAIGVISNTHINVHDVNGFAQMIESLAGTLEDTLVKDSALARSYSLSVDMKVALETYSLPGVLMPMLKSA